MDQIWQKKIRTRGTKTKLTNIYYYKRYRTKVTKTKLTNRYYNNNKKVEYDKKCWRFKPMAQCASTNQYVTHKINSNILVKQLRRKVEVPLHTTFY